MRELLLLVMIYEFLKPAQSVNGVLWDKESEDFVPIFSVPAFAAINQKVLSTSRREETYNFQGKIVKLLYYEETNILNSNANGTKVTGIIGEIWNALSEYLNFTLKPVRTNINTIGYANSDGEYQNGLLQVIQRNGTDVVPRVEAHVKRLHAAQFTIPLWKTNYRLYIRREVTHLPTWMIKLFSRRVWYAILITYLLLTTCSCLSHTVGLKIRNRKSKTTLNDHFFYNFGMICGQSYLPNCLTKSSRIVELWLGLFSCLIRTAFGALLISYMTQTTVIPPFYDLVSLLDHTSYNVFTLKGSLPNMFFELQVKPEYEKAVTLKRNRVGNSLEEMYRKTCASKKLYAIFESEDIKKAKGMYFCRMNPIGHPLWDAWIVSGISWNFKHKRSIDIGILKLYEVGFIKLLQHRWIESKNVEEEPSNVTDPIIMEQVYLILLLFSSGLLISFVILLFENLTFYYKNSTI